MGTVHRRYRRHPDHPLTPPHRNAPLTVEGRRRLIERWRTRPIGQVAAEMGTLRACSSRWGNRWCRHDVLGQLDRPSTSHHIPCATSAWVTEEIESWRREEKWFVQRIAHEVGRARLHGQSPHPRAGLDQEETRAPLIPRSVRGQQPGAGQDHRSVARPHGVSGPEETEWIADTWSIPYKYLRPHSGAGGPPPVARLKWGRTKVQPSYPRPTDRRERSADPLQSGLH